MGKTSGSLMNPPQSRTARGPAPRRSNGGQQRSLRVLIDARKLGHGGIGTTIENLVRGLLALRHERVRQAVAVGDWAWPTQEVDREAEKLRLTVLTSPGGVGELPWASQVEVLEDSATPYSLSEMFALPRRIAWDDFDVFHTPHYLLPYGIPVPTVVTIHDLIHLSVPERWFYPLIARQLIRSALSRATKVITVSHATYAELQRFTHDNSRVMRRVRVVSNAIDPFFLEEPLDDTTMARCKSRQPYFLCVLSNTKPHKGIEDLVSAWERFVDRVLHPSEAAAHGMPRLIIVGQGTAEIGENAELLKRMGALRGVFILGKVTKEELRGWYRNARAVVVPSRLEGFGLPVIEAHASGTRVIARPVPALLELVSQGDVIARDMSTESFAEALHRGWISTSIESAEALREQTRARFDLLEVASATVRVYREALVELP